MLIVRGLICVAALFVFEVCALPFSDFRQNGTAPLDVTAAEDKIIGGGAASPGQFPYVASLRTISSGSHICGAVIIESRYVLTAAHCTHDRVLLNLKVVVGTTRLSGGGQSYYVLQLVHHPNFNPYTLANDIALVKTTATIAFSELVQRIALAGHFVGGGVQAVAAGWGRSEVIFITKERDLAVFVHFSIKSFIVVERSK